MEGVYSATYSGVCIRLLLPSDCSGWGEYLPLVSLSNRFQSRSRYGSSSLEMTLKEHVMRRRHDDWINATHILKAAGFDKPARTRILEREVQKDVHEKIQGGYGKYQGAQDHGCFYPALPESGTLKPPLTWADRRNLDSSRARRSTRAAQQCLRSAPSYL